jgi:hypothetical protein
MDVLEQMVATNRKEFQLLLKKERHRNDKLLRAYKHLKNEYEGLQRKLSGVKRPRTRLPERKSLVHPVITGGRVTRLVSQKK